MKRWIAKHLIHLSEITRQPVPGWVRNLIPEDELEAMESAEKDLTRALFRPRSDRPRMPVDVKERIEEAGRSSQPVRLRAERPFPTFTWAFAAISLLVLGSFLVFRPPASWSPSPREAPAVAAHTAEPADEAAGKEPTAQSSIPAGELAGDLLVKPLATEQERLAADVTNAMRYLAESFLPSAYALPLNEELQSAKRRFTRSM
jgi:hypothetical protein